jgi:hypothetical protein
VSVRVVSVLFASLLAALALITAPRGARANDPLDAWIGDYRFAGGATERARLRAELDRIADRLGFLLRDIARPRLHHDIQIEDRVVITLRGEALRVRIGRRVDVTCDGDEHPVRGVNGEPGQGTCALANARLTVPVVYEPATQTYTLARSGDGTALHMRVAIAGGQLPDTIRFRLTYRR